MKNKKIKKLLKKYSKELFYALDHVLKNDINKTKIKEYTNIKINTITNVCDMFKVCHNFLSENSTEKFIPKFMNKSILNKLNSNSTGIELSKIAVLLGLDNLNNQEKLLENIEISGTLGTVAWISDSRDSKEYKEYYNMFTKLDEKYKYNVVDNMFFTLPLKSLLVDQKTHVISKTLSKLNSIKPVTNIYKKKNEILFESINNSKKIKIKNIADLLYNLCASKVKKVNKNKLKNFKDELNLLYNLYELDKECLVNFTINKTNNE